MNDHFPKRKLFERAILFVAIVDKAINNQKGLDHVSFKLSMERNYKVLKDFARKHLDSIVK